MKNLFTILLLLISYVSFSQEIVIMEETKTTIILNGFKKKSENHLFKKVGSVDIYKKESVNFNGVVYFSKRYIIAYRDNMAITFVEWEDNRGEKKITNYYIK